MGVTEKLERIKIEAKSDGNRTHYRVICDAIAEIAKLSNQVAELKGYKKIVECLGNKGG